MEDFFLSRGLGCHCQCVFPRLENPLSVALGVVSLGSGGQETDIGIFFIR